MSLHVAFYRPNRRRMEMDDARLGPAYASETLGAASPSSDDISEIVTDDYTIAVLTALTAAAYVGFGAVPMAGADPRDVIPAGTSRVISLPGGFKVAARAVS